MPRPPEKDDPPSRELVLGEEEELIDEVPRAPTKDYDGPVPTEPKENT